jgi:glyoxylase-like metal-dependent hydrolase (beta-lactamase superfamily II)
MVPKAVSINGIINRLAMNKILKKIMTTTGIIIAVLALASCVIFLKIRHGFSKLAPLQTERLVGDIFAVKDDYANMFIIQDGAQYIVIDCAIDQATVAEQMKKLGINPNDVTAVFLTHTDKDHVGALGLFGKAKLYMSKEEERMISGKKSRFLWFVNSIPRTDYTLLQDREIIQTGNLKIEGIAVPGHTSGMMAYLVNDKYLFTGDLLRLKNGKIAPIPSYFDMDAKQAAKSREIIRHIPGAEYIFTAHWGYTNDYKTAIVKTN